MPYPSSRLTIEQDARLRWLVQRETWFIDRRGEKEWRVDLLGAYDTCEEAEAAIALGSLHHG